MLGVAFAISITFRFLFLCWFIVKMILKHKTTKIDSVNETGRMNNAMPALLNYSAVLNILNGLQKLQHNVAKEYLSQIFICFILWILQFGNIYKQPNGPTWFEFMRIL